MSLGYVDLTALVEYIRVAMSTTTMRIKKVHGSLPSHGGIQRSHNLCTYPIAIGGGHCALHIGQSACATSTIISDIFLVHGNPGIFFEQRSLGNIPRGKFPWTYFLDINLLSIARWELFFWQFAWTAGFGSKCRGQKTFGHIYREIISLW